MSEPSVKITVATTAGQGKSWAGAGRTTRDQAALDASYSSGSGTSGRAD